MRVGAKEMTIFCVDAFQITDETGNSPELSILH